MPKSIRSRLLVQTLLSAILVLLAIPAFAQSLSLLDARVVEGNAGDALLVFEARLSAPASGAVRFDFATSDGSATIVGNDYRNVSVGQLSIPAGQTRMLVSVPVNGDVEIEANEYLNATVSNVTGASVARAAAKGLIVNDDNKMLASAPVDPGAQSGSTGYATEFTSTSGDGRLVAFVAVAQDLVAGRPGNLVKNVYVRDSRTGVTTLASIAADGGDANGDSNSPVLSANGRYLVFQSTASNIVANDNNMSTDLFRRDLLTGTTSLVSVNAAGTAPAGGFSVKGSISSDGRYIAFQSSAADLVIGIDTGGRVEAFLRDMQAGTTTLVSLDPYGTQQSDALGGYAPQVSADGRYVVYDRGGTEPWRRDMQTGAFVRAAIGAAGAPPNSNSYNYGVSADGRYVLFMSFATNLDPQAGPPPQVFVTDVQAGTTRVVSLMSDGSSGFTGFYPSMSSDGRYVAFQSSASPVGDLQDGNRKIYVRDLQANTTIKVSNNWLGSADSGGDSENPSISADGRVVSFLSLSPIMLPGDDNGREDVFRVELPQDPTLPLLSIADASVTEGDNGTRQLNFTVSLSAPATWTIAFLPSTSEGTATAGVDYLPNTWTTYIPAGQTSATVAIDIVGDSAIEADESFNLYVDSVYGARVADGRAVGTIVNDDVPPLPSISIGDVSISEGNSGTKLATFTVSLSAASTTAVTFDVATANGSAVAGSDYVATSQTGVTIPAGSTSQTFTVAINGDGVVEPNETFLVNIGNVSGATIADGQAVGTITNDDAYPTISIGNVSVLEGNSGTSLATFTLTLSSAAASPVTYDIATSDGTATAGSDYVAHSLTGQIIPVGASSATFTVTINGDNVVETAETFKVNLANVAGAVIANGQGTGTIINDDLQSLSIADVSVVEGNSGTQLATFTVQLSGPAATAVTYDIATANGTAVAPTDYTAKSLTGQPIPAGATSASFTVSINGDLTIEPNETFLVNVSNVTGAGIADGSAVGTITTDDTLPALSIADVSIAEGNNSSKLATFTVSLSKVGTAPVTFNIATANGTAVAPGDYTATSATNQAIAAGSLRKTFTVSIKGDKQVEPNETFFVNVSNVSGATVADGQALGTIVNDDGAALTIARVTTDGLYDDIDDRRGDPVLSSREYALLLLDSAQRVCARAGGASIVAVDGVENLAVLADLADTANRSCARQPHYSAAMKADGLGFLIDDASSKIAAHGTQVLELLTFGGRARATSVSVLAEGQASPLTVLLAATPSAIARERVAQANALNRLVRARLTAEPRARLVVLGATGFDGLVDLTARSLPAGVDSAERIWVSPAVLEESESVRLQIPGTPSAKPEQQVLQLLP